MKSTISRRASPELPVVAVIADIVGSRRVEGEDRRALQRLVERTLGEANRRFARQLAARFLITVGDELQGLLKDPVVLPEIIRLLETRLPQIELRLGIGRGAVDTDLKEYAVGMDGPAWHAARAAIEQAKKEHRMGGVFLGFGERADRSLDGLARLLHHLRAGLTAKQRALLEALLDDESQTEVARRLGISKQAVSKQARAAGWAPYQEGEAALRAILADVSPASPVVSPA